MTAEEIKARMDTLHKTKEPHKIAPLLFAYSLLKKNLGLTKGCDELRTMIDILQYLLEKENPITEDQYKQIAEETNDLLWGHRKEIIENIGAVDPQMSLFNTGQVLRVRQALNVLNNKGSYGIDLSWFLPEFSPEDEETLGEILLLVDQCVSDNEILADQFEDSYDWGMFKRTQSALYKMLRGTFPDEDTSFFTPDKDNMSIAPTMRQAKSFYELWRQVSFSEFIDMILWGTEVDLPSNIIPHAGTSETEQIDSIYDSTLFKLKQHLHTLDKIESLLVKGDDENLNFDIEVVAKRVRVLKMIISYVISKTSSEKVITETRIMLNERNRILSNLSHSIKNMLKAVIDPLMNLRDEIPQKAVIIDNAIKGANLIREIVNAINLSFQTTLEELKWDVLNTGGESMTLQDMVVDSLRYSISNMFDSRYFPAFSEKYFPRYLDKAQYDRIKHNWNEVSAASLDEIKGFLDKHMFKLELSLDESRDYHVGNEKSSAIKLLILFQEIIFNAVKYTAYVPFPKRRIEITLASHGDKLKLAVKNSFDPKVQAKTTGVGKLVIENFARVLGCSPVITEGKDTYSISLEFDNLWQRKETDA